MTKMLTKSLLQKAIKKAREIKSNSHIWSVELEKERLEYKKYLNKKL